MLGLASSLLLLFACGKDKAAETPPASPSSSAASPRRRRVHPHPSASKTTEAQADQGLGQLRQGEGHRRLQRDAEGHGQVAVGDRQDPDQGARPRRRPGDRRRPECRGQLLRRQRADRQEVRRIVQHRKADRRSAWPRWFPDSARAWSGSTRAAGCSSRCPARTATTRWAAIHRPASRSATP